MSGSSIWETLQPSLKSFGESMSKNPDDLVGAIGSGIAGGIKAARDDDGNDSEPDQDEDDRLDPKNKTNNGNNA